MGPREQSRLQLSKDYYMGHPFVTRLLKNRMLWESKMASSQHYHRFFIERDFPFNTDDDEDPTSPYAPIEEPVFNNRLFSHHLKCDLATADISPRR